MGDYQVRSWEGFHKHITLSFLAFYYVAYQKLKYEEDLPLPIRPEGILQRSPVDLPQRDAFGMGKDSPKESFGPLEGHPLG